MILTFSHESFVEKIKSGLKIHTIRRNASSRWKIGDKIHFWKDNPRNVTKNPYSFGVGAVAQITPIEIRYFRQPISGCCYVKGNKYVMVTVGGDALTREQCETLAKADGFDSFEDFLHWFDSDFDGGVICWSNFKEGEQ